MRAPCMPCSMQAATCARLRNGSSKLADTGLSTATSCRLRLPFGRAGPSSTSMSPTSTARAGVRRRAVSAALAALRQAIDEASGKLTQVEFTYDQVDRAKLDPVLDFKGKKR